jgi:hypothetical protein
MQAGRQAYPTHPAAAAVQHYHQLLPTRHSQVVPVLALGLAAAAAGAANCSLDDVEHKAHHKHLHAGVANARGVGGVTIGCLSPESWHTHTHGHAQRVVTRATSHAPV